MNDIHQLRLKAKQAGDQQADYCGQIEAKTKSLADAIQEHHDAMDKDADQINAQIAEDRKQCESVRT